MTSASSLHFGPEWMRKPSRGSLGPLSPNTGNSPGTTSSMLPTPPQAAPPLPNVSSYSSLLTSASPPPQIKSEDDSYPFRYSKDQLLRVWKDGGGRGGLGLEVERWPGIVREVGGEPLGIKEMTPEERKLFSHSVNSDPPIRRNTNLSLAPDRQNSKFGQGIGIGLGPASPRGIGAPRRRGTGNAEDPSAPFLPRKLSLSSTLLTGAVGHAPNSPGAPLPSPHTRTRPDGLDHPADPWARGPPAAPADTAWNGIGPRRRTNDGVATRAWGNPAAPAVGLGIGRGISFGSLANGGPDDKLSPSASPGPGPASNDALAPAVENDAAPAPINGGEVLQNPGAGANTIYATNGLVSAPPGLAPEPTEDLANLQWSYKDPTGQIQGPFLGTAMQQWFEHGYFSEDLLIKRNGIDLDFDPLRDFRRRAAPLRHGEAHPQVFLLPLAPRAPPNLPPPPHLLGSNTPPNPSPRLAHLMTGVLDSSGGPMSAGVNGGSPLANSPAIAAARSATLDSYLSAPQDRPVPNGTVGSPLNEGLVVAGSALSNAALERKKREEFIQSLRERELAMAVGSSNTQPLSNSSPFAGGFVSNPVVHHTQYSTFSSGNTTLSPFNPRTNMQLPPAPVHGPVSNIGLSVVSPFPHSDPVLWSSSDSQLNTPGSFTASPGFDNTPIYQSAPRNSVWQEVTPQESSWEGIPEQYNLPPAVEAAAYVAEESLQTAVSDPHVHESPSSFHPSLPAEPEVESITSAFEETTIELAPLREATPEPVPASIAAVSPTPSNKRKNTGKGKAASAKEPVAPAPASPPAATPAKAWATLDEEKSTSLSLREIQETEARKAEAVRKATRVVSPAPVSSDEATPASIIGSWGLPQVGARSNTAPTPTANGAPAWTKPVVVPTGKKSMKEIQEEEERRKRAVAAKEAQSLAAAQLAAKRAYAESAKNVSAAPGGGAWTTVGAQGKVAAPPAAVRQPSQTTPVTRAVPGVSTASSSSANAAQPTKQVKPAAPEETPVAPSLDFLKWLKEALKGLNGINVEEFMQMLLSFPLDPSPAVIEIISDSIYANSSTLDGRRFAAEFCQKRKVDAAAARTKPASASGAKVPRASLAEVVKTQPKPVQSEWGFKTVQKKAKGGRK